MSDTQRIIFNDYAQRVPDGVRIYSDTPIVELEPIGTNASAGVRPGKVPGTLPGEDPLFDQSLAWSYRGYHVRLRSDADPARADAQLGTYPEQPVWAPPTVGEAHTVGALYLFNVIVALEWYPSEATIQRLQWAFRRASDLLCDITDGQMAFGQVIFGGPAWLDIADIQIMASNRFHPRSWVDGLHMPEKHLPIRVGRGIWNKAGGWTIPWDEPEAYRSLVHEWCHYALALKDDYLEEERVKPSTERAGVLVQCSSQEQGSTLVIPQISLPLQSIMAGQPGVSELAGHRRGHRQLSQASEWEQVVAKYPFLRVPGDAPVAGPGRLPLPLPRFHDLTTLRPGGQDGATPPTAAEERPTWGGLNWGGEMLLAIPSQPDPQDPQRARLLVPVTGAQLELEHCWVYIIKGTGGLEAPEYVLAQGTLEASPAEGFWLLGAAEGDRIALIGTPSEKPGEEGRRGTVVYTAMLEETESWAQGGYAPISGVSLGSLKWEEMTPSSFPAVGVIPVGPGPARWEVATRGWPHVRVRVGVVEAGAAVSSVPWDASQRNPLGVLPLGRIAQRSQSTPAPQIGGQGERTEFEVGALDGYVLAHPEGGGLVIDPFGDGGTPTSGAGVRENPTTGGSPEGNVMLFFSRTDGGDYSHLELVTTLMLGVGDAGAEGLSDVSRAHSYAFCIASNDALPRDLNPTLIMFYDPFDASKEGEGDLLIYRLKDGKWIALDTYVKPDSLLAAVPLRDDNAGGTLVRKDAPEHVERYRLYWRHRGTAPATGG